MHSFTSPEFNFAYPYLVKEVMDHGTMETQRGTTTRELHPVVLEVTNPLRRLVTAYGRPVNVPFALAEVLWILGGRNDVAMLQHYNSKIGDYSDDGTTFNAAYGDRLRHHFGFDQLADVVRTLKSDPGSRQAVLNMWSPPRDRGWLTRPDDDVPEVIQHATKDRACNVLAHPMIRGGRLDWLQVVRSNDAMWGAPYNWMQWTYVQEYVAASVGVPVGKYVHVADSFHIYDWHWEEARKVRPFNLYMELSWVGHAEMVVDGTVLDTVLRLEEEIREQGYLNSFDCAQLPHCWQQILQILRAHDFFKRKEDRAAFQQLTLGWRRQDHVYVVATLRFWWGIRWHKMSEARGWIELLQDRLSEPVLDWIMEEPTHG